MNRDEALRIDRLCERYLSALEALDFEELDRLWRMVAELPDLEQAFHEIHQGVLEKEEQTKRQQTEETLTQLVAEHLPSATTIPPPQSNPTVAQVIEEMGKSVRQPPTPEWTDLVMKLQASTEELPRNLGYSSLKAWAENRFGSAPSRFWQEFQQAALTLELRRAATTDYALAARSLPTPKRDERNS